MTRGVIDASVVVKWLVKEEGDTAALQVRQEFAFDAPDLAIAEITNVLRTKNRRGEIDNAMTSLAVEALSSLDIELHALLPLRTTALELAIAMDHSVYDCFYLALAQQLSVPFVTADERLKRKFQQSQLAQKFPVTIHTLAELAAQQP